VDRTLRAALLAALIAFVSVAGIGLFLVPDAVTGSIVAGVVAAVLSGLLLLGASRRADSFAPPPDARADDDHGDDLT
jgi:hypothetical protein